MGEYKISLHRNGVAPADAGNNNTLNRRSSTGVILTRSDERETFNESRMSQSDHHIGRISLSSSFTSLQKGEPSNKSTSEDDSDNNDLFGYKTTQLAQLAKQVNSGRESSRRVRVHDSDAGDMNIYNRFTNDKERLDHVLGKLVGITHDELTKRGKQISGVDTTTATSNITPLTTQSASFDKTSLQSSQNNNDAHANRLIIIPGNNQNDQISIKSSSPSSTSVGTSHQDTNCKSLPRKDTITITKREKSHTESANTSNQDVNTATPTPSTKAIANSALKKDDNKAMMGSPIDDGHNLNNSTIMADTTTMTMPSPRPPPPPPPPRKRDVKPPPPKSPGAPLASSSLLNTDSSDKSSTLDSSLKASMSSPKIMRRCSDSGGDVGGASPNDNGGMNTRQLSEDEALQFKKFCSLSLSELESTSIDKNSASYHGTKNNTQHNSSLMGSESFEPRPVRVSQLEDTNGLCKSSPGGLDMTPNGSAKYVMTATTSTFVKSIRNLPLDHGGDDSKGFNTPLEHNTTPGAVSMASSVASMSVTSNHNKTPIDYLPDNVDRKGRCLKHPHVKLFKKKLRGGYELLKVTCPNCEEEAPYESLWRERAKKNTKSKNSQQTDELNASHTSLGRGRERSNSFGAKEQRAPRGRHSGSTNPETDGHLNLDISFDGSSSTRSMDRRSRSREVRTSRSNEESVDFNDSTRSMDRRSKSRELKSSRSNEEQAAMSLPYVPPLQGEDEALPRKFPPPPPHADASVTPAKGPAPSQPVQNYNRRPFPPPPFRRRNSTEMGQVAPPPPPPPRRGRSFEKPSLPLRRGNSVDKIRGRGKSVDKKTSVSARVRCLSNGRQLRRKSSSVSYCSEVSSTGASGRSASAGKSMFEIGIDKLSSLNNRSTTLSSNRSRERFENYSQGGPVNLSVSDSARSNQSPFARKREAGQGSKYDYDPKTGRCKKHPSILIAKRSKFRKGTWDIIQHDGCPMCNKGPNVEGENDDCEFSKKKMSALLGRKSFEGSSNPTSEPKAPSMVGRDISDRYSPHKANNDTIKQRDERSSRSRPTSDDARHSDESQPRVSRMPYTTPSGQSGWYTGFVNDSGKPHGNGRMRYKTGNQYEGVWTNGNSDEYLDKRHHKMKSGFCTNVAAWKEDPRTMSSSGGGRRPTSAGHSGSQQQYQKYSSAPPQATYTPLQHGISAQFNSSQNQLLSQTPGSYQQSPGYQQSPYQQSPGHSHSNRMMAHQGHHQSPGYHQSSGYQPGTNKWV